MAKPKLSLDAVRLHRAPVYNDDEITGFATSQPAEVRGTLYMTGGGTMKLWQPLTDEETRELEEFLARVSGRILSAMTAALSPDDTSGPA